MLRLIQFGEGRTDTRRQQPIDALRSAGDDAALFDATLQRLADNRLITLSGAENQEPRTKNQLIAPGSQFLVLGSQSWISPTRR
jgi:hypothetical protein